MNHQDVFDIASYCVGHGITEAVLCPGSRNALMLLSFSRHPGINCRVIADERVAAFTALGIAQASGRPVAIACTSGTAAINFAPAIAEAFYSQSPLVIFTADRPPEWIDQYDGQTIHQEGLYNNFVKHQVSLPVSTENKDEKWQFNRLLNEGLLKACQLPSGPVHFNVPIREPFYPDNELSFGDIRIIKSESNIPRIDPESELMDEWNRASRILIIPGQENFSKEVAHELERLTASGKVCVIADHISNAGFSTTEHHDLWINQLNLTEDYQPDLLITWGQSIISKSVKLWLRNNNFQSCMHWQISRSDKLRDPYQSITRIIKTDALSILKRLPETSKADYAGKFTEWDLKVHQIIDSAHPYSEFACMKYIAAHSSDLDHIHLSNSMPVRYANFFSFAKGAQFHSNRGTSGIDGCTSTAIGHALSEPNQTHLLITGDTAFLYDINAFWQKNLPQNLKIVVFNNQGGGIFRIIPGPSSQPELEEFFEVRHDRNTKSLAEEYKLSYFEIRGLNDLSDKWKEFLSNSGLSIMECFFTPEESPEVLNRIRDRINSLTN